VDAKTLCLGVLLGGDATGYDIRKQFEEGRFSAFHQVGFGSIYPALNRLREAGLVTVTEQEQDGRPDKKVHAITPAGRAAFIAALGRAPAADRLRSDALFMLCFADLLPAEGRRALLDTYAQRQRDRLAEIAACPVAETDCPPGSLFVRNLGRTVYATILRYIDDNRHLVEAAEPTPDRRPKGGTES
jgi:DNA-binding PadR family transcriptional regulator